MGPMQNLQIDLKASRARERILLWQNWMGRGIWRIKISSRFSTKYNYQCLCFFRAETRHSPFSIEPYVFQKPNKFNRSNFNTNWFFIASSFDLTASLLYRAKWYSHQKGVFPDFKLFWHVSTLKTRSYWQSYALTHQNNTFWSSMLDWFTFPHK